MDPSPNKPFVFPYQEIKIGKVVFSWANMVIILFLEPRFLKYEKYLLMWKLISDSCTLSQLCFFYRACPSRYPRQQPISVRGIFKTQIIPIPKKTNFPIFSGKSILWKPHFSSKIKPPNRPLSWKQTQKHPSSAPLFLSLQSHNSRERKKRVSNYSNGQSVWPIIQASPQLLLTTLEMGQSEIP